MTHWYPTPRLWPRVLVVVWILWTRGSIDHGDYYSKKTWKPFEEYQSKERCEFWKNEQRASNKQDVMTQRECWPIGTQPREDSEWP